MSMTPIGSAEAVEVAQSPVRRKARIAVHLGHALGAGEDLRLVLAMPDHAVEAGGDVERLAGDGMDALFAEGRAEAPLLRARALVEPERAGAQRRAVLA